MSTTNTNFQPSKQQYSEIMISQIIEMAIDGIFFMKIFTKVFFSFSQTKLLSQFILEKENNTGQLA